MSSINLLPEARAAEQINALHNELTAIAHKGINVAIEIGRLLSEKKAELSHGEFGVWVKRNLVFTDRTARNYMKLFADRDKVLQAESISQAYRILNEGKTETVSDFDSVTKLFREYISAQFKTVVPLTVMFEEVYNAQENYLNGLREEVYNLTPDKWQGTKDAAVKQLKRIAHEARIIQNLWGESEIVCLRNMGKLLTEYPEIEKYITHE